MKEIIVLLGFARSGVTILNRCLVSDKRLICLSEINSRFICPSPINTPSNQMEKWYGLKIKKDTPIKEIREIKKYADKKNKTLLIRDWSFSSFVPLKYNNFKPPLTLNIIDDLEKEHKIKAICFVRNPIDVWLSMKNSEKTFHDKNLDFLYAFIKDIKKRNILILKYEDFCLDPVKILNKIYKNINLKTKNKVILSNKVTGDIDYPKSSRGFFYNRVVKIKKRILNIEDKNFLIQKTKALDIMKLLKYDTRFLENN